MSGVFQEPGYYDPLGNILQIDGGESTGTAVNFSASYTYDQRNRLKSWTPGTAAAKQFNYDKLGNLTGHAVGSAGTVNQQFSSTRPHAVTRQTDLGIDYGYDPDGNLLWETWSAGGERHYSFDALNRLRCVGSTVNSCNTLEVHYDAGGSRIHEYYYNEFGAWLERHYAGEYFTWDTDRGDFHIFAFGELIAHKRRYPVSLRTAGLSWLPSLDFRCPPPLALALLAVLGLAGLGVVANRLDWVSGLREQPALGAFSLVLVVLLAVPPLPARGGGGGTMLYHRWILSDHLGSASVVLEAYPLEPQRPQGRAEREIVYAPFGRIHDDAGAVGTDSEVYAGHPREPATNLHYMQARWQNPETGSFLSVDPLISIASDPQSYNGYSYARNNSISITDPTGMCYIGGECPIYNQGWYFVGYEAGLQTWVTYADARGFEPDPFGGIPWTAYQDGRLIDAVASQFRSGQAHVVWALFMGVGGGATSAVAGGSHGVEFAGPGAPRSLEEIRALDDWGLEPLDPIDPELVELYEQLLIVIPAEGAAAAAAKAATRGAPLVRSTTQLAPKVDDVARNAAEWLGRDSRVIRNPAGDKVFVSKDGLRRIRFDINRPHPHQSPHMHVEEQVNGRWVKSGPIFPRDVAPR